MRRISMFLLAVLVFMEVSPAFAMDRNDPAYQKMKEYKIAQRAKREEEKKNPQKKEKGFWAREAERSGFAGTGAMFGNAVTSVIPLGKPNSRKEQ